MKTQDWGIIDYPLAEQRQLDLVDQVASGSTEKQLVFCRHPATVTLGRGTKPGDLLGWQGPVFHSQRGGRATYHGPGQMVIYPILDLRKNHVGCKSRDIHAYLRALETAVVMALASLGVRAQAQNEATHELSGTGVWIGKKKIASIGIAVRKWIAFHGVAINLVSEPNAFSGINPCGYSGSVMTALADYLNPLPSELVIRAAMIREFSQMFTDQSRSDFSLDLL